RNNPINLVDPSGTRTCTLAMPLSITYGLPTTTAYAGGAGATTSTNPSVLGSSPTSDLNCIRTRPVIVKYNCTDTIRTYYAWCPGMYTTTTVSTPAWLTQPQEQRYSINIAPDFLTTIGVEAPIPKIPGGVVTYYWLKGSDQAAGNHRCNS